MPYYVDGLEDRYIVFVMPEPNGGDPEANKFPTGKFRWNTVPISDEDRANVHKKLTIKEVPKALRWRPIDFALRSGFDWYVSDRVKTKLEDLGAGKIEFFPGEVKFEKHEQPIEPFWYMATMNQLDAIDVDRTTFNFGGATGREAALKSAFSPSMLVGEKYAVTLKRSEIDKEHFWRVYEYGSGIAVFFCSDVFHDWMVENDVLGMRTIRCEVLPQLV